MQLTLENQILVRAPKDPGTDRVVGTPEHITAGSEQHRLNISALFTRVDSTATALRVAAQLANQLCGRITLMVPEVVPYHLPLNEPPINHEWNERRFREIVAGCPVETTIRFLLCRDVEETLLHELKPHSLVVIGGPKRWWPTRETRLAQKLRRMGHEVIVAETE